MLVATNSESDLPFFPLLNPASKHDSHGFPETWFRMKSFLPDLHVSKWLLDSAHDAMPYYLYCRKNHIQLFIDLNVKRGMAWHVSQRFIADLSLMSAISGLLLRKCLFFQNQDIPVF